MRTGLHCSRSPRTVATWTIPKIWMSCGIVEVQRVPLVVFAQTASSLVARTSVTRLLVKAEAYALRVTAKGHSTESWFLRSRGVGFASGLPDQCYRLLQVGDLEENINLRSVLAVKADSH